MKETVKGFRFSPAVHLLCGTKYCLSVWSNLILKYGSLGSFGREATRAQYNTSVCFESQRSYNTSYGCADYVEGLI